MMGGAIGDYKRDGDGWEKRFLLASFGIPCLVPV